MHRCLRRAWVWLFVGAGACAPLDASGVDPADDAADAGSPFAVEVLRFAPGPMAGFGQEAFPDVVLGAPLGQGTENGSRDVLSLGIGGEIELRLGVAATDGPGADLLVFENPFACRDDAVFGEAAEVSVSDDGETWHTFPCTAPAASGGCVALDDIDVGCAGFSPVFANEERGLSATQPLEAGGDAFDLAALGLSRARYVRIRDQNRAGGLQASPTAGFDLDAIAAVRH